MLSPELSELTDHCLAHKRGGEMSNSAVFDGPNNTAPCAAICPARDYRHPPERCCNDNRRMC